MVRRELSPDKGAVGNPEIVFRCRLRHIQQAGDIGVVDYRPGTTRQQFDKASKSYRIKARKQTCDIPLYIGFQVLFPPDFLKLTRFPQPGFGITALQPVAYERLVEPAGFCRDSQFPEAVRVKSIGKQLQQVRRINPLRFGKTERRQFDNTHPSGQGFGNTRQQFR